MDTARIIASNRLERLVEDLCTAIRLASAAGLPWTAPVRVVVPDSGIEQWLKLELARRLGCCAGIEFSRPAQWAERVLSQGLPLPEGKSYFSGSGDDTARLAWRILSLLSSQEGETEFPLSGADPAGLRVSFANSLAAVFARYAQYRPEWLAAWSAGAESADIAANQAAASLRGLAWQKKIWQLVAQDWTVLPLQELSATLSQSLSGQPQATPTFFFDCQSLTPLQQALVGVFYQLAGAGNLFYLFYLNPCSAFWQDTVSERSRARMVSADDRRAAYSDVGSPLLAAWGRETQKVEEAFNSISDGCVVGNFQTPPENPSYLQEIQASVLEARPVDVLRPDGSGSVPPDPTFAVHSASSMRRQVQVLQDYLLDCLKADPSLRPHEIFVAVPDIATAAPAIHAVFGAAEGVSAMPYRIFGTGGSDNAVIRALLLLMDLLKAKSRIGASDFSEFVCQPCVLRALDLTLEQAQQCLALLAQSGFRWSLSQAQRMESSGVAAAFNTFEEAFGTLALSAVRESEDDTGPSLTDFALASRIWNLAQALERLRHGCRKSRSVWQWMDFIQALSGESAPVFKFDTQEASDWSSRVLPVVRSTLIQAMEAGMSSVSYDVFAEVLCGRLEDNGKKQLRRTGGVTFAPIGSLRGVPFRIIAILGLDEGAYPVHINPLEFDLLAIPALARSIVPSDGSIQRNAVLDLILAARERLLLSYAGKNPQNGTVQNPSVLLEELMRFVGYSGEGLEGAAARPGAIVSHPLHGFSRRAFLAQGQSCALPGAFSHDGQTALALSEHASSAIAEDCAEPQCAADSSEPWTITLEEMIRFVKCPAKVYWKARGVSLPWLEGEPQDCEDFAANQRNTAQVLRQILPQYIAGLADRDALADSLRAGQCFAPGRFGEPDLQAAVDLAASLGDQARSLLGPQPGWRPVLGQQAAPGGEASQPVLSVELADVTDQGRIQAEASKVSGNTWIDLWLRHLAMCAFASDCECRTRVLCAESSKDWIWTHEEPRGCFVQVGFAPVDGALAQQALARLASWYAQAAERPLVFVPALVPAFVRSAQSLPLSTLLAGQIPDWTKTLLGVLHDDHYKDRAYQLLWDRGMPVSDTDAALAARFLADLTVPLGLFEEDL